MWEVRRLAGIVVFIFGMIAICFFLLAYLWLLDVGGIWLMSATSLQLIIGGIVGAALVALGLYAIFKE